MEAFGSSEAVVSEAAIRDMITLADGYPLGVVARVVEKYRLGHIEGQSYDFPPKLPQLAVALRSEPKRPGEDGYVSPEEHRRRMVEQNAVSVPQHSEQSKARIRKLVAEFRAGHDVSVISEGAGE